ncbi:MAG: A/G-specific adenine glycosylase [Oscillospiraceae bacterium]|nr:A/G-specific adenine glycosylase [Oscillospiraceae bacterium]
MTTLEKLPAPLLAWYGAGHRDLPWRQEVSPYRTWVSEIMLQQTRVAAVIPYFERFMAALPTVEALAAVDEPTLLSLWQGLGYYNRARNLRLAAKKIVGFHGGQFPHTYEEIRMLPGVGDYTAGAIAFIAFGLPTPAVDGNVLRVVARLTDCHDNILAPATRRRVTEELAAVIPHDHPGDFNQALMELGATVCLPNTAPMCEACPCRAFCQGFANGTAASLPVREKKEGRRKEEKTVFILRSGEYEAVRYRGEEGLLASLWEYPNVEGTLTESEAAAQLAQWNVTPHKWVKKAKEKHIFTHIVWEMTVYTIDIMGDGLKEWQWRDEYNAHFYPMPTAFSKLSK